MQDKDGFVFAYAIDEWESLVQLRKYYQTYNDTLQYNQKCKPIVLAGNKLDLDEIEGARQVKLSDAKKFAEDFGADHFECSAQNNENIKEVWEGLFEKCIRQKYPERFKSHTDAKVKKQEQLKLIRKSTTNGYGEDDNEEQFCGQPSLAFMNKCNIF